MVLTEREEGEILELTAEPELQPQPETLTDSDHPKIPAKACYYYQTCKNLGKYKCPKCQIRTCSLACNKNHKSEFSCNGIKDKTRAIPKTEYNESHFRSDIHFLESINREIGNVLAGNKRKNQAVSENQNQQETAAKQPKISQNKSSHLGNNIQTTKKFRDFLAKHFSINLIYLPTSFQRRLMNSCKQ